MRRREFIGFIGGAAAWPMAARAQQPTGKVRWVGVMRIPPENDPSARESTAALEESLGRLGWSVGHNLSIDYRWGVNDLEKGRSAVAQILRLTPDVILAGGGPALMAAQQATATVPIIFTEVSEPVERGFIASLARPGGNTTGFTNLEATIGGKWLELLKEIAPGVRRVAALFNPNSSFAVLFFRSAESAAQKLRVEMLAAHVHDSAEIDSALTALAREPGAGLMLPPDGFTAAYRRQILGLTTRYGLPVISSGGRPVAAGGGLITYGVDLSAQYRQAATYVDRILRGEKPADLPAQNPTKFELVINMKTARALGLTVPLTLQVAADEVIE